MMMTATTISKTGVLTMMSQSQMTTLSDRPRQPVLTDRHKKTGPHAAEVADAAEARGLVSAAQAAVAEAEPAATRPATTHPQNERHPARHR